MVSPVQPNVATSDSQPETTSPVHSSVDEESSTHYQNLAVGAPLSKSLVEQKMGQSERGAKPSDQPYPRLQARLRASDVLMERPSPLLKPPSVPHHNRQHTGPATLRPREVKESQLSSMILSKTPASKRRLLEIYLKGILQELNQDHLTSTFIRARRGCVLNVIWRLHHIGPPALLQESCRTELEANSTLDAAMMALAKHGKELQQIFVQLWADLHQKLNDALVKFEEHQKKLKNRKEPKQWLDAYMCVQSFRRKYQSDVQKITDDFLADGCVNFLHDALGEYAPKSEPLPEEVLRYQPDWKGDGEWPQMPDLPEHDSSYLNDPSFNYREYEEAMS